MLNIDVSALKNELEQLKSERARTWNEISGLRPNFKGEEETSPKYLPNYIERLFEGMRVEFEDRLVAWENAVGDLIGDLSNFEGTGGGGSGGSGGAGGVYGGVVPPTDDDVTIEDPNADTTTPPNKDQGSLDFKLPIEDLADMSDALYDILQDDTLEDFLADPNNQDLLKELLKELPLSDEVKKQLEGMDAKDLADLLGDIYHGNRMDLVDLSKESKDVMYEYLEQFAQEHGITLHDLLTNSKYADLLKGELEHLDIMDKFFEDLLTKDPETIQQNLLFIYNGNMPEDMDAAVMIVVRILSDQMAKEKNITVEELYLNPEYRDFIKERITDMEHTTSYLKVLSKTEGDNAQKVTHQLLESSDGVDQNASSTPDAPEYQDAVDEAYGNGTNNPQEVPGTDGAVDLVPDGDSSSDIPTVEPDSSTAPDDNIPDLVPDSSTTPEESIPDIVPDEGYGDVLTGDEEIPYVEPDSMGSTTLTPGTEVSSDEL